MAKRVLRSSHPDSPTGCEPWVLDLTLTSGIMSDVWWLENFGIEADLYDASVYLILKTTPTSCWTQGVPWFSPTHWFGQKPSKTKTCQCQVTGEIVAELKFPVQVWWGCVCDDDATTKIAGGVVQIDAQICCLLREAWTDACIDFFGTAQFIALGSSTVQLRSRKTAVQIRVNKATAQFDGPLVCQQTILLLVTNWSATRCSSSYLFGLWKGSIFLTWKSKTTIYNKNLKRNQDSTSRDWKSSNEGCCRRERIKWTPESSFPCVPPTKAIRLMHRVTDLCPTAIPHKAVSPKRLHRGALVCSQWGRGVATDGMGAAWKARNIGWGWRTACWKTNCWTCCTGLVVICCDTGIANQSRTNQITSF